MSVNDPDEAPPPADTPSVTLVGDTDSVPGACVGGVAGGVVGGLDGGVDGGVDGGREPCGRSGADGTGRDTDTVGVELGMAGDGEPGLAGGEACRCRARPGDVGCGCGSDSGWRPSGAAASCCRCA